MSHGFDFVTVKPHLLQESALVNAFDLLNTLVDDMQLADVREVAKPVHPVDVIQAKVNALNVGHILFIDAKKLAL